MRFAKLRPHHRPIAELGAHAGECALRRSPVAGRSLREQPLLYSRDGNRAAGHVQLDDPRTERQRFKTQSHQIHQQDDVQRRGGGTEPLDMRIGAVQPQAHRQLGQRLVARGHRRQYPVEQTLDVEEKPNGVGFGVVEVAACDERLDDALRLQRRPQVTGGEPMQALRLRAETTADPVGGQSEERPHGSDPEHVQAVPEHRVDAQPAQPHPSRPHSFGSGVADHRHRLAGREGPGDGMGAEP